MAEAFAADEQTARDGTLRTYYHVHALHARGRDVVTASAVRSGSDTQAIPRTLHAANVVTSVRTGTQYGLGELVTSWTVRHVHPEVTMPAVYAGAVRPSSQRLRWTRMLYGAYAEDAFGVRGPSCARSSAWPRWGSRSRRPPRCGTRRTGSSRAVIRWPCCGRRCAG